MEKLYLLIIIIFVGMLIYWHQLKIETFNQSCSCKQQKKTHHAKPLKQHAKKHTKKHVVIKTDDVSIDSLDSVTSKDNKNINKTNDDADSTFTE